MEREEKNCGSGQRSTKRQMEQFVYEVLVMNNYGFS